MKQFIIALLMMFWSLGAMAQATSNLDAKKVSKNMKEDADFVIYLVDTGQVNVTWHIEYSSDTQTFKITEGDSPVLTVNEPLQLDVFTDRLNTYLKGHKNVNNSAQASSVYKIFQDLRSLAYGEDATPPSGTLFLNSSVYVSTAAPDNELEYDDRRALTDSLSGTAYNKKITMNVHAEKLDTLVTQLRNADSTINKNALLKGIAKASLTPMLQNYQPATPEEQIIWDNLKAEAQSQEEDNKELSNARAAQKKAGICEITDVQFQFEKGFLEKVIVTLNYRNEERIFENIYAIGFTSAGNYKALYNIKLYIRSGSKAATEPHIFLSDVIQNYKNFLANYSRDYSPADTTLTVDPKKNSEIVLHKDRLVNLFEAKAFTDLVGLGANNPNGLIQLQVDRRFNLITTRKQLGHTRGDWGSLNYLNLTVTASKLENKDRSLILQNQRTVDNLALVSPSYATTIDFLRYENLAIRMEINALSLDYPEGKFTFNVDLGAKYGYTPLTDSILTVDSATATIKTPVAANSRDGHNFTVYPKFWFEFFPDPRFGLTIGYQVNTTWVFSNNQYKQVLSYSGKGGDLSTMPLNYASRFTHEIELTGRIDPNPKLNTGKIFLAARFFMQNHDVNSFFAQVQIGYAYNLVFKK